MDESFIKTRYNLKPAAAWIRGQALRTGKPELSKYLLETSLPLLIDSELAEIVEAGQNAKMKLYPFKSEKAELPRVRRVMSFLHGVEFQSLLDVGSGRGVFILPFMDEFPCVQITSLDLLEKRVTFLNELSAGGYSQLKACQKNICDQPYPDNSFDVVTCLEVLEHIPNVDSAVKAAVNMARKYVVVTVPSKPDDNPEHIHLFTKDILTRLFSNAGCTKLHFDGVEGHMFLVAAVEE